MTPVINAGYLNLLSYKLHLLFFVDSTRLGVTVLACQPAMAIPSSSSHVHTTPAFPGRY